MPWQKLNVCRRLDTAGQLAILGHFKCSLGADDAYFVETASALLALQPAIAAQSDDTALALNQRISDVASDKTKVCRFSKAVIQRVSN